MKMRIYILCFLLTAFAGITSFAQNRTAADSGTKVKFIDPEPGFRQETFVDCSEAEVMITHDTLWTGDVFLMKNYTDQLLQICATQSVLPASAVWGYNRNGKYFRSANPFGNIHVYAERIVQGKLSLYYCRALPHDYEQKRVIAKDPNHIDYRNTMIIEDTGSGRYKNEYYYFISPASDSSKMIVVDNSNIDSVAEKYLKDCPTAHDDAMKFKKDKKIRIMQKILLPVAATAIVIALVNFESSALVILGVSNPIFYVAIAAVGIYAYLRINKKDKSIHPNDMIRIISNYNNNTTPE